MFAMHGPVQFHRCVIPMVVFLLAAPNEESEDAEKNGNQASRHGAPNRARFRGFFAGVTW